MTSDFAKNHSSTAPNALSIAFCAVLMPVTPK
jgi:hypothetical protein